MARWVRHAMSKSNSTAHFLQTDVEKFQQHVRRAYQACAQAVNEELARKSFDERQRRTATNGQSTNGNGHTTSNGNGYQTTNGNGNGRSNGQRRPRPAR